VLNTRAVLDYHIRLYDARCETILLRISEMRTHLNTAGLCFIYPPLRFLWVKAFFYRHGELSCSVFGCNIFGSHTLGPMVYPIQGTHFYVPKRSPNVTKTTFLRSYQIDQPILHYITQNLNYVADKLL
jgi:hypothetical protein